MASFDEAFNLTVSLEGGYVNDSDDSGGETKYGISKKQYPDIDIENLTLAEAKDIYRNDYWRNYGGINCQIIANKMFDIAVNCGQETANHMLQLSLIKCGYSVKRDGIFGPETLAATNSCYNSKWLMSELQLQLIHHYLFTVASNPAKMKYLKGWISRAINPVFLV